LSVVAVAVPEAIPPVERTDEMNETVMKPFEAVVPAIEKAAADGVAQAKATQEQVNAKMTEVMETMMKSMTEMSEFAKGNLEAMMASAKAAAAGAETLSTTMVETSKKQIEEAQAAWKAMTSAKTPNEMLTAQNEFAKAQFEKTVAAWSHLSETMLKLSGDVVQPLSNRMAVAAETVKKAVAA
jgi:phasin family protein